MKKPAAPSKPMIDRYKWYEVVAIYAGIALLAVLPAGAVL